MSWNAAYIAVTPTSNAWHKGLELRSFEVPNSNFEVPKFSFEVLKILELRMTQLSLYFQAFEVPKKLELRTFEVPKKKFPAKSSNIRSFCEGIVTFRKLKIGTSKLRSSSFFGTSFFRSSKSKLRSSSLTLSKFQKFWQILSKFQLRSSNPLCQTLLWLTVHSGSKLSPN